MPTDPLRQPSASSPRVAVIGGGVTGLVAARRLALMGVQVTVFEAADRWGGELRTISMDGLPIDVGAEALHLGAPAGMDLLTDLDLTDRIVQATPAPTWLYTQGRLRALPAGFGPAGPTRLWPLVTSGILSPSGVMRASLEPLIPRMSSDEDMAVGHYLAKRFGDQVVHRLIDPLLGGLHAGDVGQLSLEAATPHLAALAANSRSLMLRRRPRKGAGVGFATLQGGMRELVDALVADLADATLLARTPVRALVADGSQYRLSTTAGDMVADAVVLAVPSDNAAPLLAGVAPQAATAIAAGRSASVAVSVHAYPRQVTAESSAFNGTGLLVGSGEGRLLKAATFLSTKWPHLADGEHCMVRLSAGRVDDHRIGTLTDDEVCRHLHEDLREITGLRSDPVSSEVFRWPRGMPQLEVGHLRMMRSVRAELAEDHPRVMLAGGSYDGIGVSACIGSAHRAADHILASMQTVAVGS